MHDTAYTEEDSREADSEARPWGLWATLGFSVAIAVAFVGTQVLVGIVYVAVALFRGAELDPQQLAKSLESDGNLVAIVTWATLPVVIGLCVLFSALRKGITVRHYLGLQLVPAKTLAKWCLFFLLFIAASDGFTYFLGRSVVTEFMTGTMISSSSVPFLILALVVAAPLTEEVFCRGFLFKGIQCSRLGPAGAILISSLVWSLPHIQYDWYGIVCIFVSGLLIGLARYKSGSIVPCLAMHALMNTVATVETIIVLHS